MKMYLSIFIDQAKDLMNNVVNFTHRLIGEKINYKFYCLLLCMDSVARPVVQFRVQFNGHYGCSWCYAYGFYDGSAMRYLMCRIDPKLRSHESYLQDVDKVERIYRARLTINGVKGRSELLRMNHFNCVWGLPIDYMHGVLLGVTKQLWSIWTTASRNCYLKPSDREEINNRRSKIKRPHEIQRLR
ncbi:uncharacterized protein LOC112455089 [Temnothorax curvispinosus]|uniref:Uncharacterized protein LOC112455089 n=1 Tax=Temnothorax curvispinosus TaxID=300111 RepID=A0A6J1PUM6_9HYME|nr:uncharacterized protein LOC112455089 [Temnothorax curvispinosus]